MFPKNSGFSPQIIHFNRVFHYKPSMLGAHPYFWKHPYTWGRSSSPNKCPTLTPWSQRATLVHLQGVETMWHSLDIALEDRKINASPKIPKTWKKNIGILMYRYRYVDMYINIYIYSICLISFDCLILFLYTPLYKKWCLHEFWRDLKTGQIGRAFPASLRLKNFLEIVDWKVGNH